MTFVWKQLQGVTYQCSFNGQEPEDCELSATALDPFYAPPSGRASTLPTFFLPPLSSILPSTFSLGSPEGFTVPGNSLRETGNILVITLYMDSQPVGEQSFSELVACVWWVEESVGVGVEVCMFSPSLV